MMSGPARRKEVICAVVSETRRGALMFPIGVSIAPSDWDALVAWSVRAPHPSAYPSLAGLLAGELPREFEVAELRPVREEVSRVPAGDVEGAAAAALALLRGFLEGAASWEEAGGSVSPDGTRVSAGIWWTRMGSY